MKKIFFLAVIVLFPSIFLAQNKLSIYLNGNSVALKVKGQIVKPGFTPGNHCPDNFLDFKNMDSISYAELPDFKRNMSSGKLDSISLYHISSGLVPRDLKKSLKVRVNFPKGKTLLWCGEEYETETQNSFKNYFVGREFPLILVPSDKYLKRVSKFNKRDSMTVFFTWTNDSLKKYLPLAFQAVDSAASIIGNLAPKYLHNFLINYAGRKYSLVFVINDKVVTGLEHYNAPYVISTPRFISKSGVLHTLLHSFIGKSAIPKEYMAEDGEFHQSDALGFYEGLVTFLSLKYEKNFSANLSALVYRAKINQECADLTQLSTCGARTEKWYSNGYLFWFYMQSRGLIADSLFHWLFEERLQVRFPVPMRWSDVLDWITDYNEDLGKIARQVYSGEYVQLAFDTLQARGWSPIPVWKIPRWYDKYIGPYPIEPNGILLPTDNYPVIKGYPAYLLSSDGKKLPLELKDDNPALVFIKSHPDSTFEIEFSDGTIQKVENKLKFTDGSPYFMYGNISIDEKNKLFWQSINIYIK